MVIASYEPGGSCRDRDLALPITMVWITALTTITNAASAN
jgi:hypothetical protein